MSKFAGGLSHSRTQPEPRELPGLARNFVDVTRTHVDKGAPKNPVVCRRDPLYTHGSLYVGFSVRDAEAAVVGCEHQWGGLKFSRRHLY